MVVVDKGPRQKAPISIDAPVQGAYTELLKYWQWFYFIPIFLILFTGAICSRVFGDIWITRYAHTCTWLSQNIVA